MFQILSVLSITHCGQLNFLGPSLFRPASLARQLLLKPVSLTEEEENAVWSLIRILAVLSCISWERTENIMVTDRI